MKRNWLSALLAITLSISLVSCGSSDSGGDAMQSGQTNTGDKAQPLTVALWDKNQEVAITPIVKKWGQQNGYDISVEVTPWEQYWSMLEAGGMGNSMPDVFWMHSLQVRRYANNDLLMDVTDKIKQSELVDLSKFPADITSIYNINEKQVGIPKDLDTIALWYNKTMFDEAGVAYPTADWNWTDLKDAATKLTKPDGSQYGFGLQGSDNQGGYWNFIYQNDGYVINEEQTEGGWTHPKTKEAMEFFVSFVEEKIAPPASTTSENDVTVQLESGLAAMGFQGSWMIGELANNDYILQHFDCIELPAGLSGKRATIYNGLGWSASAGTKNPDGAWALLEYLGSEEAQVKMGAASVCNISAHEAGQVSWSKSNDRFRLESYTNQIQYGVPYPSSINSVVWENMTREKVSEMLLLERPVATILEEMQQQMNQDLAKERS